MSYFHDYFTTNQNFITTSSKSLTTSDGVSNACERSAVFIEDPLNSISIEDRKLRFSVTSSFSEGSFLKYDFYSPYPTFPPMIISTTVSPKTTNTYSLEYTASNKKGTVNGKIVGNSLSFELDELQSVKNFTFIVTNKNGVSSFTLTELIGVPIKQVYKPRRRHEIIGVSKISFPLAQHQSE